MGEVSKADRIDYETAQRLSKRVALLAAGATLDQPAEYGGSGTVQYESMAYGTLWLESECIASPQGVSHQLYRVCNRMASPQNGEAQEATVYTVIITQYPHGASTQEIPRVIKYTTAATEPGRASGGTLATATQQDGVRTLLPLQDIDALGSLTAADASELKMFCVELDLLMPRSAGSQDGLGKAALRVVE